MKLQLCTIVTVLVVLLAPFPPVVKGQDSQQLYLPYIIKGETEMSDWKVIAPEVGTNLISHPSVEDATITAFVAVNAATRARAFAQSRWGVYSLEITPHAVNAASGIYYQITGTATTDYTLSMWVYGESGVAYTLRIIDGVPATLGTTAFTGTGAWQLVEVSGTTGANTTVRSYITKDTAAGGAFYIDGLLLQALSYRTTYIDGDQAGCEWLGASHASLSQRSSQSREGGRVRDFLTDYSLRIKQITGVGAAKQVVKINRYALLPGGEWSSTKVEPGSFTIVGTIVGTSWTDLHDKRQALLSVLQGPRPVKIRYTGATVDKEILALYDGGLEASISAGKLYHERVAIRFITEDPYWYEIGDTSVILDSVDTLAVRLMAGRLKATGQWNGLGTPAMATAAFINAIVQDETWVYFAGDFTNLDGEDESDYIARYNKVTGVWDNMGTAADNTILCLAVGPDGKIYAGGTFLNIGGGGANRIAVWDPVAESWAALGVGLNNSVEAMVFGLDGLLYIAGGFNDIQGGPGGTYNYIITWNTITSAWAALGLGLDNSGFGLTVGIDGEIYVTGNFVNAGGAGALRVASWNPTTSVWSALGTGADAGGRVVLADKLGNVYIGGFFTTLGGTSALRVGMWNGSAWVPLGTGADGSVLGMSLDDLGSLYVSGAFTTMGGLTTAYGLARWNGSAWTHWDIDPPAANTILAVLVGDHDPVIERNYNLYVGLNTTGNASIAGLEEAVNGGTADVFPEIVIEWTTGGSAVRFETLRNETTGRELYFNYTMLEGERLTIDLDPTKKSIISSMFGPRPDAILAGSDFGTFLLQPGANDITLYLSQTGATLLTYAVWKNAYNGLD